MSSTTNTVDTSNQRFTNYNYEKIFIGDNTWETVDYTNGTGSELTLEAGTLMGRISSSGEVLPLVSTATDGSQFPVGILSNKITVADAATVTLSICVSGEVDEDLIVFSGSEGLETIVSSRRLRDRIAGDTLGIKLRKADELTAFDNS